MEIMAAHRIPYAATATPAFPDDLTRKVEIARDLKGTRFLHILAACPPGWKMESGNSIASMRAAVDSGVFPLYEVRDGLELTITHWPEQEIEPEAYFEMQGRFRPLLKDAESLAGVRRTTEQQWQMLLARHLSSHPESAQSG